MLNYSIKLSKRSRDEQLYKIKARQPYQVKLNSFSLNISKDVFPPDLGIMTRNLGNKLKTFSGETALDMGCGSGFLAMVMKSNGIKNVYALDNHPPAVACTIENCQVNHLESIRVIESDLYANLKENIKFDLVVFAQPYYPSDGIFGLGQDGGADLINRFLVDSPRYLNNEAIIIMPFSSFAGTENDPKPIAEALGYEVETIFNDYEESTGRHFIYKITYNRINEQLKRRFEYINKLFKQFNIDNSVLVFNFVIFANRNSDVLDVTSHAYGDCTRFYEIIGEYTEKVGFLFDYDGVTKKTENLGNQTEPQETIFQTWRNPVKKSAAKDTTRRSAFLREKKYGGCAITFYYNVKENIDIGVFMTLSKPFDGLDELTVDPAKASYYAVEAIMYDQISTLIFEFGLDYIIKANEVLEKKTKKFIADQEYTKAHQHTIRNFGFEGHLTNLYDSIVDKDFDMALLQIEYINSLTLLRDIAIDCIYSYNDSVEKSLIYTSGNRTFSKILRLIRETSTGLFPEKLAVTPEAEQHPLNLIKDQYLIETFNLLINLYSNTRKFSNGKPIEILVSVEDNSIHLVFKNEKRIPGKFIKWMLEKQVDEDVAMGNGIRIIVDSLSKLPHISVNIPDDVNKTNIILTIEAYENTGN